VVDVSSFKRVYTGADVEQLCLKGKSVGGCPAAYVAFVPLAEVRARDRELADKLVLALVELTRDNKEQEATLIREVVRVLREGGGKK
jgi:hypothetical protein